MRGAALHLTSAVSGFVVVLLSVPAIQSQNDWAVTYPSTEICAIKGSTVDIPCTYTYPSRVKNKAVKVLKKWWFTVKGPNTPMDLTTHSSYTGHVEFNNQESNCTLTIKDLRESDSTVYKFTFETNQKKFTSSSGVSLSVTGLQVKVQRTLTFTELQCHSSCNLADASYVWFNNRQKMEGEKKYVRVLVKEDDSFSCAVEGRKGDPSPQVYPPKLPSVSVSPSAEIVEGSSVNLTCSSDANPAANYTWYKENGTLRKSPVFVFQSIQSSHSGRYYCSAENELGWKTSESVYIDVKYAPQLPSVSVSPSAEIVEGSSVNLICSSDANPAANYTWYKENKAMHQGPEGIYHFASISSEDRGIYYCKSENQFGWINSSSLVINVLYAPKLPSVSVSPSAEIVEGSSVTLTCSSDANPAANYTWYKENEDSPKASGQIFTIIDLRLEHSGNYFCESQNTIGRHNSPLYLTVVAGAWRMIIVFTVTVFGLALTLIPVFLWIINKSFSRLRSEPGERGDNREQLGPAEQEDDLYYASVQFSKPQTDGVYSNVTSSQPQRDTKDIKDGGGTVEYAAVTFNRASTGPGTRSQEAAENPPALYSTVNKVSNK
ncbi:hypothetical protein Q8A73_002935 [Channa argus]|nr:hypothetical protein Q8A73_002935 [Channa argus]